jgi:L-fuculose-phosphate aldolase
MYRQGFIAAADGNVSARLGRDRVLVTPSGLHKGYLEPLDVVVPVAPVYTGSGPEALQL